MNEVYWFLLISTKFSLRFLSIINSFIPSSYHLGSGKLLVTIFQAVADILLLLSFHSLLESSAQQNKVFV